jgi:hypothetical protein
MKSTSIIGLLTKVPISWFNKADYINDGLFVSAPLLGEMTYICIGFKPGSWNLFVDLNALLLFGDVRFVAFNDHILIGEKAKGDVFYGEMFNDARFGDLKSNVAIYFLVLYFYFLFLSFIEKSKCSSVILYGERNWLFLVCSKSFLDE